MLMQILLILQKHGKCDEKLIDIQLNRLKQYASEISPYIIYPKDYKF